jgi:ABC-type phosphate transport system auxiliary subunit
MSDEQVNIEELRKTHVDAQTARRGLEHELRGIDGELSSAIASTNGAEIIRLTRRKAALPALLIEASSIEAAHTQKYYQSMLMRELDLAADAEQLAIEARDAVERRRLEMEDELRALEAEAQRRQIVCNSHNRQSEDWSHRLTVATERYQRAMGEFAGSL